MRPNGKSRVELEHDANVARSKLLRTVEQLDRRGHEVLDLRLQLRNHLRQVVLGAGVLMLATVGMIGIVVHRVTAAAERRRVERGGALRSGWRRPRPEAQRERPWFVEVVRSVAIGALTTAAMIPVRRLAARLAQPDFRRAD
jgi:hypothetical protein